MNVDKMNSGDDKETENNVDQIIQLQIQITWLLNVMTKSSNTDANINADTRSNLIIRV